MCGIAGILYKNSAVADSKAGKALIDLLDGCQHRGPDSTGLPFAFSCNERRARTAEEIENDVAALR